jgi:hypothetical protein
LGPVQRRGRPVSNGSYRIEAVGLNQIFGHHEDGHVQHVTEILAEFPRVPKVPNGIYGLRHTRNIENLLMIPHGLALVKAKMKPWFKRSPPISKEGDSPVD